MSKMLIDEATVKLALEALECKDGWGSSVRVLKERAVTSLRTALSAPKIEGDLMQRLYEGEEAKSLISEAEEAINALRSALAEQPAQQEPVAIEGQRKLVEILAENWRVWPASKAVEQTSLGDVYCSAKGRDLMLGNHEIASDQDSAVVTKEMWSTLREALAEQALDKMAENARELGLDYEPAQQPQRWAVFCQGCRKEWSVSYPHPGKDICVDCDDKPAQQDSTCSNALRAQGKAYPRTCKKCGFGPCVELAQQALDKKAENAREL